MDNHGLAVMTSGWGERKEDGVEEYTIDGLKNQPKEKDEWPQQEEFHLTGFDDDLFDVSKKQRRQGFFLEAWEGSKKSSESVVSHS